ncbi:accessory gland protein Acp76A [Drosophila biarmipes]|uniref:accessory gland protein Acp76A n=1 Tax=Drosophila biarmipes TaxID=125945 RepID=UPI0007E853C9|nr:accessory gland protein Acp76A [Drosophila biarmipes]
MSLSLNQEISSCLKKSWIFNIVNLMKCYFQKYLSSQRTTISIIRWSGHLVFFKFCSIKFKSVPNAIISLRTQFKKNISHITAVKMNKPLLYCVLLPVLAGGVFGNRFQINLIKQLSSKDLSDNFVVSPFAIHQALTLLYLGKSNRRDVQLARALRFTGRRNAKILSFFWTARSKALKQDLKMANRLYLSSDNNATQHMMKMSKLIGVDVESINFTDGLKSSEEIKKWLHKSFDKGGQNIVDKNDLTNITKIVGLQGISMSCDWKHRFKSLTKQMFTVVKPNKAPLAYKVEMMYTVAPLQFFNDDEVRGVMIPFSKTDIGMLVLIPRRQLSTQKVLQNLNKYLRIKLRKAEETHLFLPLFTVHETMDLNTALKALGLRKVFADVNGDNSTDAASFRQYNFLESKANRVLINTDVGSDNDQRVVKVNQGFVFVIKDHRNIFMVGRKESL